MDDVMWHFLHDVSWLFLHGRHHTTHHDLIGQFLHGWHDDNIKCWHNITWFVYRPHWYFLIIFFFNLEFFFPLKEMVFLRCLVSYVTIIHDNCIHGFYCFHLRIIGYPISAMTTCSESFSNDLSGFPQNTGESATTRKIPSREFR